MEEVIDRSNYLLPPDLVQHEGNPSVVPIRAGVEGSSSHRLPDLLGELFKHPPAETAPDRFRHFRPLSRSEQRWSSRSIKVLGRPSPAPSRLLSHLPQPPIFGEAFEATVHIRKPSRATELFVEAGSAHFAKVQLRDDLHAERVRQDSCDANREMGRLSLLVPGRRRQEQAGAIPPSTRRVKSGKADRRLHSLLSRLRQTYLGIRLLLQERAEQLHGGDKNASPSLLVKDQGSPREMTISSCIKSAGLHRIPDSLTELLEGSPAVLSPNRKRQTGPHRLVDDRQLGRPVEVLGTAPSGTTARFADQPQPPVLLQLLEMPVDARQGSPAV